MRAGLRVDIATVGFDIRRIIDPLIEQRADKVYLLTHSHDDKATAYIQKILHILFSEKYLVILTGTTDIWYLFECLNTYKKIMKEEDWQ